MTVKYSEEFEKLIDSKDKVKKLLHGSFFKSDDFQKWTDERLFIASAINQSGRIIDIGCSNGFLLKCFQEWTKYELVPYGIDTEGDLINEAKKLFPEYKNNFIKASLHEMPKLVGNELPKTFNIIYWNVWDNWEFEEGKYVEPVRFLVSCLENKGRLILGFYDVVEENNRKRIKQLEMKGIKSDGQLKNPEGHETIIWIDKNDN